MLLLADESLDNDVVRGLRRRRPGIDLLRAQDVGLSGRADPEVLAWAAGEGRVVVTHDAATMPAFAWERVGRGERMPGLVVVAQDVATRRAIEDLLLLVEASGLDEWESRVLFLPFD